jgi:hypothetical protein
MAKEHRWERMHVALVKQNRQEAGREEAGREEAGREEEPISGALDRPSVKTTETGSVHPSEKGRS